MRDLANLCAVARAVQITAWKDAPLEAGTQAPCGAPLVMAAVQLAPGLQVLRLSEFPQAKGEHFEHPLGRCLFLLACLQACRL